MKNKVEEEEETYSQVNVGNEMIHLTFVDVARTLLTIVVENELLEFNETDISIAVEIDDLKDLLDLIFVDFPPSKREVSA